MPSASAGADTGRTRREGAPVPPFHLLQSKQVQLARTWLESSWEMLAVSCFRSQFRLNARRYEGGMHTSSFRAHLTKKDSPYFLGLMCSHAHLVAKTRVWSRATWQSCTEEEHLTALGIVGLAKSDRMWICQSENTVRSEKESLFEKPTSWGLCFVNFCSCIF